MNLFQHSAVIMENYNKESLILMRDSEQDPPDPNEDFITHYLRFIGESEAPILYHRWCAIASLGAFLGRQFYYNFGHSKLHTNLYVMLIGVPATRKSTAIKIAKKTLISSGYETISADRTSKEKFLLDLSGEDTGHGDIESILSTNLWGDGSSEESHEMWIACDEFNDFIGVGNVEFISMLGTLWDFEGHYENRIKSGKSVRINNPTISILGGNTPVNFARAFPAEILGQGFFSRLLLVHADPTGIRITFPQSPSTDSVIAIRDHLCRIKEYCKGEVLLSEEAQKLLDKIYKTYSGIDDSRFEHYSGRRFPHLIKLCLVICASRMARVITKRDVIVANTILTHTENLMPKALGEFGKSRNSDVNHKVLSILNNANESLGIKDIWKHLSTEMDKIQDLGQVLQNLMAAEKIMNVGGEFLVKKKIIEQEDGEMYDWSILTTQEKEATR